MDDAHYPVPLTLERKVSRLGQRLGVGIRFMLFALVVVAVVLQLRRAAEPERAFVRQVAAEPGRLLARWPELGGSAWESLVSASAKVIPDSESVLFLGVTPGTLVADIAYLQACYALYPRQVVRLPAKSLSEVAASQVISGARPLNTKYIILYHISEQEKLALYANRVIKKDVLFLKDYDQAGEKASEYLDGLAVLSDEIELEVLRLSALEKSNSQTVNLR